MKTYKTIVLSVAVAIIASTAVLLARHKPKGYGDPGVKVGPTPIYNEKGEVAAENSVILPENVLDASSRQAPIWTTELNGLPRDTTFGRRQYKFADKPPITTSVVLMKTDRSSIHQPQNCLVGQGWTIAKTEPVSIKIDRPAPYDLTVLKLTTTMPYTNSQGRLSGLYVYWFVGQNKTAIRPFELMWSTAESLLLQNVFERWAYISYFTMCEPGQEDATYKNMEKFIAASVPEFQLAKGNSHK